VSVPDKPSIDGLEAKWSAAWERDGIYHFDRTRSREEIYSIDTPPPTVSGALHVGHVFSYTHTDLIARYQRMRGREVFYPIGFDDNGLPTERRVQNFYGVRCDPSLPYEPAYQPRYNGESKAAKDQESVSRRTFVELCERLTLEDEKRYEALWRQLGLSVDWNHTYTTIGPLARTVAQRGFLHNLARGEAYQAEAPTLWDVTFRTAVAQAELEDRDAPGAYYRIAFARADGDGEPVRIETTRPELLPACVALVAHPDDARYQPLFGTCVRTPLFGVEVPVVAHRLAAPDKGSGIAMICTFGDLTDVIWWRELQLPTRAILGVDGRVLPDPPDGVDPAAYSRVVGKTVFSAREEIVSMLRETGALEGDPKPITHPVKFYEKGSQPLEIVTSRQWYIRNGGRDADLRDALLKRGRDLDWHPPYMQTRYVNWVEGLAGDWLVSRQRYFGVPFPIWYPVGTDGVADYNAPIIATEDSLPVDPASECPPGYLESQRGETGGFIGDSDVMDTWATSSLSPEITSGWGRDEDLFARVFPMDLRPQAHDIIRTWLFATVVRSHLEFDVLPWAHAAISGFVVDPKREKISKSKGNADVGPAEILSTYGSDAVRWRAATTAPGTDTPFDEAQMKVGRRLAIKILNASKFALSLGATPAPTEVGAPIDAAMLASLADVIAQATAAFDDYDYTRALKATETFFWTFCDDYVELVKERAYGSRGDAGAASATAALGTALDVLLRLFAPFMPYVTEEVWSWWKEGSIHRAAWPTVDEVRVNLDAADPSLLTLVGVALSKVRGAKSTAKVSMRTEVSRAVVRATAADIERLQLVRDDLAGSGSIAVIDFEPTEGNDLSVDLTM
jgi:valyl-tRNA synthetase